MKIKNPWLGLESYREGEVLYGRDDDIRDLTQSVLNDTDTLLYGKSGIGKSSILNAGIFPAARRNGYLPVLVRLSHKENHSYLSQIKSAIACSMIPIKVDDSGSQVHLSPEEERKREQELSLRIKKVVDCKDAHKESLYEYFHRFTFHAEDGERIKLLIIFDQFEEIFTLQEDESKKKRFFAELADFINDIMPTELQGEVVSQSEEKEELEVADSTNLDSLFNELNLGADSETLEYVTDNDIHLVFTIREDFLSEFEYYSSSIPSLKQNRYGLRPLNEEQAAQIILRPIPGLIDQSVAKLIIEKVTGRSDFELDGIPEIEVDSAVLSLYLNRLYDAKTGSRITSELVEDKGGEIIADFYLDAISDISETTIQYLEDKLLNGKGRRDNITVFDAIHDGGVTERELHMLCDKKKILRQFNYAGELRIEFVHDILCPVVKAHKDERLMLKQQEEERQRQEEEKQRILLEEKVKREQIEREAAEEKARLKAEAIRTRKRNRRRFFAAGVFILVLILGFVGYYWYTEFKHESYYAQFERINGWPVGVGDELTPDEMARLPLYYKLSHKGYLKYDTDVEVCSSNGRLPRIPRIFCLEVCENDSDACAQEYLNLLKCIKSIHFEAGEKDQLIKEVIKGENDSILYYVNYFYLQTEGQAWAQFVSSQGQAMAVRGNGLDRIKLTWHVSDDESVQNRGRIASMMFFDASGVNKAGANGIYGYQLDYSDNGMTTSLYSLDQYGRPFNAPYNVVTTSRKEQGIVDTRYAYATSIPDSSLKPVVGPSGFWREVRKDNEKLCYMPHQEKPSATCLISTNKRGNTTQLKMQGHYPANHPAIINYTYAEDSGYRTGEEKLNADGSPFNCEDGIYMRRWQYDNNGQLTMEEHYDIKKEKVYSRHIDRKKTVLHDVIENKNDHEHPLIVRIDTTLEKSVSTTYYGKDHHPINIKQKTEKVAFHRMMEETEGDVRTTRYYRYDPESGKVARQIVTKNQYGIVESFYCKREVLDNDQNVISRQIFDEDENIVKSMQYLYQNGQNIGRSVMGIDGTPVRCPFWEEESYAYYKLYFTKDFKNQYASAIGVNEWEGTSIFYDILGGQYGKIFLEDFEVGQLHSARYGDFPLQGIHKQFIFITDKNVTNVSIPYLHILSKKSLLYTCNNGDGLKDGDRIVKLGSWSWQKSESLLASEWKKIGKGQMEMVVLRPDSKGLTRKTFKLDVTNANELELAEYHVLALTMNELKMINKQYE